MPLRLLACACALLASATPALADAKPPRPNVVIFLADDLGWANVGWHGSENKTPNLDALAKGGARLEQFYVLPVCSPTRAALLTGRYPMRYGLQQGVVRPWAQYGLALDERTLAQALKQAGYTTAIVGKWHLGHFRPEYLPTRRGFDRQYGHYNGALDYYTHVRDGGFDWHRDDKVCRDEGYTTHLLAKEAVGIIDKHDGKKPLFLYLPFNAPHGPYQVPEKYTQPYAKLPKTRQVFAGMIAAMDEAVGQVLAALDAKKMRGDTLVLFFSDNGGVMPGARATNTPLRAGKGTLYEGGVRAPALAAWPGQIKAGSVVNDAIHVTDLYPTLIKLAGGSLEQKRPLDGVDVWPTIAQGKASPREEMLLNATPAGGAIRVGDWKLHVRLGGKKDGVELYNLKDDPGEKIDLAAKESARVKQLRARYDALAKAAAKPLYEVKPAGGFKAPKVWGEKD